MSEFLEEIDAKWGSETANDDDIDKLREMVDDAPVVRLVNNIIIDGIRTRASDIHIEPP